MYFISDCGSIALNDEQMMQGIVENTLEIPDTLNENMTVVSASKYFLIAHTNDYSFRKEWPTIRMTVDYKLLNAATQ